MTAARVACIIPTRNGGRRFLELMVSLQRQVAKCDLFVADSHSSDDTCEVARAFGADVESIPVSEFSHGGTRQMMVERHPYDFYVFLTQDALPRDENAIALLLAPFRDARIGAVCGRQIAHEGASPVAVHARSFSYPAESRVVDLGDSPRFGVRTALMSNSFAAYRATALREVGGFPKHVIMAEDVLAAAKMLLSGWKIGYSGEAVCRHSHDYSMWEECRRYFDLGVVHAQERWLLNRLGGVQSEGLRYVISELRFLGLRRVPKWPVSLLRNVLKLLAYSLGKREGMLPRWLKRRLSMHPRHWTSSVVGRKHAVSNLLC